MSSSLPIPEITQLEKCLNSQLSKQQHEKLQALIQSAVTSGRANSDDREPTRRTVSINTSLMWEILDYTLAGRNHRPTTSSSSSSASASGSGFMSSPKLFHPSLFPNTRATSNHGHTVVETQIFHVPAGEPDTSDGGQAMPPYAGRAINNDNRNDNNNVNDDDDDDDTDPLQHQAQNQNDDQTAEDATTPTPTIIHTYTPSSSAATAAAQRAQMQYPPLVELANSPWAFSGNLSVLDGGNGNGGVGTSSRDPFLQFQDIGSPFLGLWEVGSL